MRADRIIEIWQLLLRASYEKMNASEKREFIVLRRKMRPIAEEAEKDQKDAEEMLKPEVLKDLQAGKIRFENMTEAERAKADSEVAAYSRELAEAMRPTLEREHEIEFPRLTTEAFDRLFDSNPKWTGAQMDALLEAFDVEY